MSNRRNDSTDWLIILVIIVCLAPFLGAAYTYDRTKRWAGSEWTPQRRRFWISTLIGLVFLIGIGILIAVKALSH